MSLAAAEKMKSDFRSPPIARVSNGLLQGAWNTGAVTFKGIPYGTIVTGRGRWKPAEKAAPWAAVRSAVRAGPRAMQDDALSLRVMSAEVLEIVRAGAPGNAADEMAEECLTLDVWTPSLEAAAARPVIVWLHGGGFFGQMPPPWWTDGTNLSVAGNVVVVAIKHRLGAFGYLNLAAIGGSDYSCSGNVGNLDLVLALEWVRDNIASFGGDPRNVTLMGEAGGAAKVACLLTMPSAKGLFHKAIIQSGPAMGMAEPDDSHKLTVAIMQKAGFGVDQLDGFIDAPAAVILRASSEVFSSPAGIIKPTVDGTILPTHPFEAEAPEISADVPLIIGTNRDEATLPLSNMPGALDLDEPGLYAMVHKLLGHDPSTLLGVYRSNRPSASPNDLFVAIATDRAARIPSIRIADKRIERGHAPTYMYLLEYETEVLQGRLRASHMLDIPLSFRNVDIPFLGTRPARLVVAEQMSGAWISFAHHSNPGSPGGVAWPEYRADRATLIFGDDARTEYDPNGVERQLYL